MRPHPGLTPILRPLEGVSIRWKVSASGTVLIDAEPETALAAVADYQAVRPKILPHYSDVTNWTVAPAVPGSSVMVKTSRQGAGGVGGFFEKTLAPLRLRQIEGKVLENLRKQVEGGKRRRPVQDVERVRPPPAFC
jgi:hypothetical protein